MLSKIVNLRWRIEGIIIGLITGNPLSISHEAGRNKRRKQLMLKIVNSVY